MIHAEDQFEAAKQAFLAGLAQMELRNLPGAQSQFERSLALLPGRSSTLVNLGAVRLALGQPQTALPVLEQACKLDPGNAQAWAYRGQAQKSLEQRAQAVDSLAQAAALQPGNAVFWINLSEAQIAADQPENALTSLNRLVQLAPQNATAWSNRGMLLRELQRPHDAAKSFEKAVAAGSGSGANNSLLALNQFYWAAAQAEVAAQNGMDGILPPVPPTAPRQYVEKLFDQYAADFDAQLVQGLHYQGPEMLLAGLRQRQDLLQLDMVLDLGCGSGLCGPLLRPVSNQLHGLDISAGMLQKARGLALYDHLFHADALEFLGETSHRYNLVVAADVLIYIGDLAALFALVARCLLAGGQFAFTLEQLEETGGRDVQLMPTMRYAHSETYVRRMAAQHGFEVKHIENQTLRFEKGLPLPGLFVYLHKSAL